MFDVGSEVMHERWGTGVVIFSEPGNAEGIPFERVRVEFDGGDEVRTFRCPPVRLLKGPFEEAAPEVPEEAAPEVPEEAAPEVPEEAAPEVPEEAAPEASDLSDGFNVLKKISQVLGSWDTKSIPEEAAPEVPEEAAPTPTRRMKVRRQWGGPEMGLFNRHLDTRDKRRIKEMYDASRSNIGTPEDLDYIDGLIEKKLEFLKRHPVRWQHNMGEEFAVLNGLLADHRNRRRRLEDDALDHITASLFWLVNPMDYFDDVDPELGYIDDAWVLKLCIEHLRRAVYQGRFVERAER